MGTRSIRLIAWTLLAGVLIASSGLAEVAQPYAEAVAYQHGQPRAALMAIETEIHTAAPEKLRAIEARLLATLASPQATTAGKDWVCRQLRLAGSEQCAAALAPLLADKELATVARLALQGIPGAKVDQVLREALGKTGGDLKAGVILTLGARRDRGAVPLLTPLAGDKDLVVAEAALYSLGQIGGADALAALKAASVPGVLERRRLHSVVLCAEGLAAEGKAADAAGVFRAVFEKAGDATLQTAALGGILAADRKAAAPLIGVALRAENAKLRLAAARLVCQPGGQELIGPVLAGLASLPADVRVTILGMTGEKAALPAAMAAANDKDENVRVAAIDAIGRLGDQSVVPLLLELATTATGAVQEAARHTLETLRGSAIDGVLVAAAGEGQPVRRVEAIRALAGRNATAAVPAILKLAEDADAGVRGESMRALGALADAGSLPAIVKLLVAAKADEGRAAAEQAVVAACRRLDDNDASASAVLAALPGASTEVRLALLRVLGRVPCAKSLAALRAAAGDADAAVKDTAVRGLAAWPDAAPMADLMTVARTAPSQVHKVLAIRGLVRMAGLPGGPPAEPKVKVLAETMTLATRADEKKMVLAALAEINHVGALEVAAGCLADKDLEVEAAAAVVKIAKNVRVTNQDAAKKAVAKVLEVCKAPAARQVAESTLVVLDTGQNIAPQGTAASPDDLDKDGGAGGDQAAIDGDLGTYWDEQDGKPLYRLVVTFKQPEKIAAVSVTGYEHHSFAPRDFEILCDGKVVKKVENAQYDNNFLVVGFDAVTCTSVELKITGHYGGSPAIRELGIYRPVPGK